jgi:SAM-dependent methyltransferase
VDKVERQRAHFDRIATTYFESRQHANHLLLKALMWDRFFAGHEFLRSPELRVLEPMCGFAEGRRILEQHLQPEFRYSGFDYSVSLIERARELDPALDITMGNVLEFDASGLDQPYDLIILIGGLHHVYAQAGEALGRLCTALRPGGHFISYEPTHDLAAVRWIRETIYGRNPLFDVETERGFLLSELNELFEGAGFELADQMYPGLLSYILFYNPDAFPLLNRGGSSLVKATFALDRPFLRNLLGRKLSFATLSLWRKPEGSDTGASR